MGRPRIGQVLKDMGKLNSMDIDEILAEQALSQRRFGAIAVSWGLCNEKNVCDAWCSQLTDGREQVNLSAVAPDLHAIMCLPAEMCRRIGIVPLRIVGNEVVLATSRVLEQLEAQEVAQRAGREVRFVRADARQVNAAINRFYPMAHAA